MSITWYHDVPPCDYHVAAGELWRQFLVPLAHTAAAAVAAGDWQAALAELLALLLFGKFDSGSWVASPEARADLDTFRSFFSSVSVSWRTILAQPDDVLGLVPVNGWNRPASCVMHVIRDPGKRSTFLLCGLQAAGRPAGYREPILRMLGAWQHGVNDEIEEMADLIGNAAVSQGGAPLDGTRLDCLPPRRKIAKARRPRPTTEPAALSVSALSVGGASAMAP